MSQAEQLAKRVREVLLDGYWVANTNYKDQIQDVTRALATTQVGALNTIAALTYHINYYLDGLIRFFEGGALDIQDKYSFDLPPIQTDQDWSHMVDTFLKNSAQFAALVETMSDAQLERNFVKEAYGSYKRNIECVIEHSYYHLGQIVLIKKMIAAKEDATV